MKELNKNEIREIQLEILKKSVDFFEENELKYFLCGGTLLGAVRHQGYIPWDDDIDLMMPRPDYERLKQEFSVNGLSLIDYNSKNQNYKLPFIKVQKNGTLLKEKYALNIEVGISIDIFPIDGFPDKQSELEIHLLQLEKKIKKIKLKNVQFTWQNHSIWWKSILITLYFGFRKFMSFFYSNRIVCSNLNKLAQKYEYGKTMKAGIAVWGYGNKEVCPAEVYKENIKMIFENKYYYAPKDFNTYLSCVYGDYMKLPPKSKQKPHHNISAFIIK